MTRILVVDDSREFRKVVCVWIASQPDLELAGEASGGREAVATIERRRPDLVLMDAVMPDMNGFEATRRIKSGPDSPPVVVLSLYSTEALRRAAEAAGADGFVAKSELIQQLPQLLETLINTERR